MEDDPNCFIQIDADLNLFNLKRTLIIFANGRWPKFFLHEWRPIFFKGRLPDFFLGNGRQSYVFQIKDDLTLSPLEDAIFFSNERQI